MIPVPFPFPSSAHSLVHRLLRVGVHCPTHIFMSAAAQSSQPPTDPRAVLKSNKRKRVASVPEKKSEYEFEGSDNGGDDADSDDRSAGKSKPGRSTKQQPSTLQGKLSARADAAALLKASIGDTAEQLEREHSDRVERAERKVLLKRQKTALEKSEGIARSHVKGAGRLVKQPLPYAPVPPALKRGERVSYSIPLAIERAAFIRACDDESLVRVRHEFDKLKFGNHEAAIAKRAQQLVDKHGDGTLGSCVARDNPTLIQQRAFHLALFDALKRQSQKSIVVGELDSDAKDHDRVLFSDRYDKLNTTADYARASANFQHKSLSYLRAAQKRYNDTPTLSVEVPDIPSPPLLSPPAADDKDVDADWVPGADNDDDDESVVFKSEQGPKLKKRKVKSEEKPAAAAAPASPILSPKPSAQRQRAAAAASPPPPLASSQSSAFESHSGDTKASQSSRLSSNSIARLSVAPRNDVRKAARAVASTDQADWLAACALPCLKLKATSSYSEFIDAYADLYGKDLTKVGVSLPDAILIQSTVKAINLLYIYSTRPVQQEAIDHGKTVVLAPGHLEVEAAKATFSKKKSLQGKDLYRALRFLVAKPKVPRHADFKAHLIRFECAPEFRLAWVEEPDAE